MHHDAIAHLRTTDPALARVIDRVGDCRLVPRTDGSHFDALVRAIVYQQLSGKAAATIHGRLLGLYGGRPPTPAELLATDDERLRAVGLSRQKTLYVKDLAAKVLAGDVDIDTIDTHGDDEIIARLTRVKGIGRWSAQMFLLFRLGRPNVLPDLDLGVQKGIQHAYGLRKLPTPKDVIRIAKGWAPYASVAAWYMWRILELPDVVRELAARRKRSGTGGGVAKRAGGAKATRRRPKKIGRRGRPKKPASSGATKRRRR